MKIRFNSLPTFCCGGFLGAALLLSTFCCQAAQAVEIAYEGFGYPTGYLSISDPALDGVYTGFDNGGPDPVVDPDLDSEEGDPARAGGSGSWVNGWTKRNPSTRSQAVSGDSTLSYTDSKGNALKTTLGRARFPQSFTTLFRNFDPSTIDPALTFENTGVDATSGRPAFEVPTLGKQGTTVWFSMLGDFQTTDHNNPAVALQFQNKRDGTAFDGQPQSITGGITITAEGWAPYDVAKGEEFEDPGHAPGTSFNFLDPVENIPGSAAADDAGTVFIVGKFDYSATFDFFGAPQTDGWADISYWINPDLNAEPTAATAALTGSAYYPINGVALLGRGNAPSVEDSSSLDEIRFGTTFADVSPIAGGGGNEPGDYDASGAVGQGDLDLVLLNWGNTAPPVPSGWVNEQPSGLIGQGNLDGVLLNWGNGSTTVAGVPEPASVLLLGFAGAIYGMKRRREFVGV